MTPEPAELKRRLLLFAALDGAAILVVVAGFIGDLAFGIPAFKAVWIVGVLGVVAVMTWLVLSMRAGKGT